MQCPQCQFENREGAKFCKKCGNKLELLCPACGHPYQVDSIFCDECGYNFSTRKEASNEISETESLPYSPSTDIPFNDVDPITGERKHVTVLFSDLTGYTAMSEKLDPEEVKEITSRIFGEISKIVGKFDGFIEKYVGDAVMAIFGVPKAHEDDPIRAVKVAREIHEKVDAISPEVENRIGQPISMHTGINTGLVVTGEVDMERGTHGVAGGTINLASRLSNLAKPGEILIDVDTCRQVEGHFTCEYLEETTVKGKADRVLVHKVLSQRNKPVTIHRLSGLRADLVGRKAEIAHLREAVENLREGKGRIFALCGDAGTGKSRLVEEFKATLDLKEIQWLEGHAYAYSQNIPYYPLIDLLNRVFQIKEGDPQEKVREKVEAVLENLVGKKGDVVPYVGGLYSLSYPELEDVSPEFWKSRLQEATLNIISALAQRAPTVFFLEDLHWADPSFVELLRHTLLQVRQPAIVLCAYRPVFSLFTSHQLSGVGKIYQEIRLQDLSLSEAQDMLESLLETETIPSDMKRFVQDKAEGNPFYLEELVNSLIETETLIRDNGSWKIARPITESDISSTIHGLISGRLDRLEKETKRILQEASVIGRAFLYEILNRVTELKDHIDHSLRSMERLDLIRTGSLEPDLEYIFKHALIQEVVYNGLLKKERQEIHERVALVIEQIFHDRLPEVYETLSFHFKQSESGLKAIDYLMKAGEKSLKRYALEEAHRYYKEAFDILINKPDKSREEGLLIDLVIKWAFVFYYRGDYKGLTDLLSTHKGLAESLDDKSRLGMFYAWIGTTLYYRGKVKDSYKYLCKALKLGELIQNQQVIGYACNHLTWTCAELGLLDEAILFGKRAQEISKIFESDHYIYFISLGGMGFAYFCKGEVKRALSAGKALVDYGRKHSNIRSMVLGHFTLGHSHSVAGDFPSAIKCYQKAIEVSVDPFYSLFPRFFLGMSYVQNGQFQEAENALQEVVKYSENFGVETLGMPANAYLGIVSINKGYMSRGLKMLEESLQLFQENGRKSAKAIIEYVLGKVYFQIVEGAGPINLLTITKNLGFLVKNVPFASKRAEYHFNKAIETAREIGAKGILGQAYLDLGLLLKAKKRKDQAKKCISEAVQLFEKCEADVYLKRANEALESLQ